MGDGIFDLVCEALERRTELATLEARGTVRLALKRAGLDAATVDVDQMAVLIERLIPEELRCRGVSGPYAVCEQLIRDLEETVPEAGVRVRTSESPEEIFRRLAGR